MNIVAAANKTVGKVKTNGGKKFTDIKAAVAAGAVQGCAPFPEGVDLFGFYNGIDEKEAQRYADGTSACVFPTFLFIFSSRALFFFSRTRKGTNVGLKGF